MANRLTTLRIAWLSLPLFFWAALLGVSVRAEDYGDVSVSVESVLTGSPSRYGNDGYGEYRIIVVNRSATKTHRVTVILFKDDYSSNFGQSRREIEVAPGSTAAVSIFTYSMQNGSLASVEIDGVEQRNPALIDPSRTSSWTVRSSPRYSILISREIEKSDVMRSASVESGFKFPNPESDVAYLSYQSPLSEWTKHWIGYSGFEGVILTAAELETAPEPSRAALIRYAESGGAVIVAGRWEVPAPWKSRYTPLDGSFSEFNPVGSLPGFMGTPAPAQVGQSVLTPEIQLPGQNDVRVYFVGFGALVVTGATPLEQVTVDQWKLIKTIFHASRPEQKPYHNLGMMIRDFPVVDRIGVPVRGLFVMMMAFVLLVGPINFFWLAGPGKKIRILWTIPIISLMTCLLVAGYALIGEGTSARSRTESLTVLDENARRATTLGWTAVYSPVTPRNGLHFSLDAELVPQYFDYNAGFNRVIDFSNDQHLASGWVSSRIPAFFKIRKNESRRERLTIRVADGSSGVWTAVNGLGVPIRRLWFADAKGRVFTAEEIAPGAQAKLIDASLLASGDKTSIHNFDNYGDWLERMKWVEEHPAEFLTPGSYLALVDQSPFVEEGLDNISDRRGRSLILGLPPATDESAQANVPVKK